MRSKERIAFFIKEIDIKKLIDHWFGKKETKFLKKCFEKLILKKSIRRKISKRINRELPYIESYWKKYPDLRFSQLLVNLDYLPNFPGMWYYEEDSYLLSIQKDKN